MNNPFLAPGKSSERSIPLNPWKRAEHSDYYVAVDHTDHAFREFQRRLEEWDLAYEGETVLVHGEDGCGKTSLAHRCAKHLKDTLDESGDRARIVDRSSDLLEGQRMLSKCEIAVRAVLRDLSSPNSPLPQNVVDSLPQASSLRADENELRLAVEEIAEVLDRSNRTLVILPSKLELPEEFQSYSQIFANPRLVLIMETSQDGVRQHVERWNETPAHKPVLSLRVGPLEVEHAWTFVESRMRSIAGSDETPRFDQSAVERYMRDRTSHSRVSIRELELVCIRLFKEAAAHSKSEISYEDFATLWLRYGGAMR
jgi:energy-coupling factor transporter ATP-binding protein EcfA2